MTPPEPDLEAIQHDRDPRPSVFNAIADVGGIALIGTVVLEMVAGAIEALTRPAVPTFAGALVGRPPVQVPRLSITAYDRLSLFVRSGANVTVALVLVVSVVAITTSRNRDQTTEHPVGLAKALMLVSGILASIVILANAAMCVEVLRNATGVFSGTGQTNRAASFIQFLAPIGLSMAVAWCASARTRSFRDESVRQDGPVTCDQAQ